MEKRMGKKTKEREHNTTLPCSKDVLEKIRGLKGKGRSYDNFLRAVFGNSEIGDIIARGV